MAPGSAVALSWAAFSLILTIWRELVWSRRLRHWHRAPGIVEGFDSSGDGPSLPIIGISVQGQHRTFVSSYCLYNPPLGESITILFDPHTARAVALTPRHRWFLTALGSASFLLFLCLAAFTR